MTDISDQQWIRRASLVLVEGSDGLDLSDMHFKFQIAQGDFESPNNASIRVYNLKEETVKKIQGEYSHVIVQAGYEGNYGVLFDGTVKQFHIGRESATDSYLDILAADGDIAYNYGIVNGSVAAGATPKEIIDLASKQAGIGVSYFPVSLTGRELIRGKVLYGMWRDVMRSVVGSLGATWSIQNGQVQIIPLQGYLPGEAVVLDSLSGLIGIPELMEEGLKVQTLINPRIKPGTLIKIDNSRINKLVEKSSLPVPYNSWFVILRIAKVSADGLYRVYAIDHAGDTRGDEWYSNITALAVDSSAGRVEAKN
jgi:hypothetical protein